MADHPAVTETAIELIVRHVVAVANPELALLVGSRAYGEPRADSDYDVLLVLRDGADAERVRGAATRAIRSAGVPVDVFASTVSDYERRQSDPGFIDYMAARHGIVLYATGTVRQLSVASVREETRGEGVMLWLRRAESDLRAAEHLMAATAPACDAVCFHSHACVEKLLKALIVRAGTIPPRTHDLAELLRRMPETVRPEPGICGACELLMALLPRARYPHLPQPTTAEAQAAIASARLAYGFLRPALPDSRPTSPSHTSQ